MSVNPWKGGLSSLSSHWTARAAIAGASAAALLIGRGTAPASALASWGPAQQAVPSSHHHAVCGNAPGRQVRCHAEVIDRGAADPRPQVSSAPFGLDPSTVKSVYGFPMGPTVGAGTTIGIVDAYDDPNVQADLDKFDRTYGLPCSGCLAKVNQSGGTTYPAPDPGWSSRPVSTCSGLTPSLREPIFFCGSDKFKLRGPTGGRGLCRGPRLLRVQ